MSETPFTDKWAQDVTGYADKFVARYLCEELERTANMLSAELRSLSLLVEGANEVYAGRLHIDTDMAYAAYCKYRCRV
jgi:hypothetical protein